jgi:PilZ domain
MTAPTRKAVSNQPERRRRRHPRYRTNFLVVATYLAESAYARLEGHCNDLSEAGIGILLAAEINIGEVIGLSFCLPGSSEQWELRGVVRYRRGYHYGFEFLTLTGQQRETLRKYLAPLKQID